MKKSEHIESRQYSRNIKIIYLCFDPNLLWFSRFSFGFCPDFAPILSSKDLPRSQFFLTKDSVLNPNIEPNIEANIQPNIESNIETHN